MISGLYKLSRRLAIKLILLISCAIIPVNLLAVMLTGIIIADFQDRLVGSYHNEMRLYVSQVDAQLQRIEEAAASFISRNIEGLSLGFEASREDVDVINLFAALRETKGRLEMASLAYLKNNNTGVVMLTFGQSLSDERLAPSFLEQAGIVLAALDLSTIPAVQYSVLTVGNRVFQLNNYYFRNFSFGFLIDTGKIMTDLFAIRTSDQEEVYLADLEGQLIAVIRKSGVVQLVDIGDQATVADLQENRPGSLISTGSRKMDYQLVRVLDKADLAASTPFTDRALQIVAFLSFLIIPLAWLLIRHLVLKPMHVLSGAMHKIETGNLNYQIAGSATSDDFQYMNDAFNRMAAEIQTLTIDSYEKDIERLQTESMNLRLQVNPHLILNSFNMIYNLAQSKKFKSIQDFSRHLTDYFRYALKQNDKLVSIDAEMKFVLSFLEVQRIRFPGAFTSVYSIDEGLENELVPPLLLENFVENSIKYGLRLGSTIEIIIIIRKQNDRLTISICDTGNGIEPDILEQLRNGEIIEDKTGQHIGIWNCRRRLKLFYGERAVLNITSAPGEGTQVWIELPTQHHDQADSGFKLEDKQ